MDESQTSEVRRRMPPNSPEQKTNDTLIFSESALDKVLDRFFNLRTVTLLKFLCISVTIGSFVYEIYPLSESYFSNKHNILNQYFVKLAWGWTMALHTPYIVLSGLKNPANFGGVLKGLIRVLAVGTTVWYFWVEIVFHGVMQITGVCIGNESFTDIRTCIKAGHWWNGFDISGHCFLLIYCILLIHEELQIIRKWVDPVRVNHSADQNTTKIIGDGLVVTFLQKLSTVLLILLEVLWILMVTMTSVYFHVWSHKLIGTLIAVVSWHCTYNIWYKFKLSPG